MSPSRTRFTAIISVFLSMVLAAPLEAQEAHWRELNTQVIQLYQQGKYADALPLAEESLRVAEVTFGPEHLNTSASLINLAELYRVQGRYADAEPLFKRALAIKEKALGPENPEVAVALTSLAVLYRNEGRYSDAVPLTERALAIRRKALGPDNLAVAATLNNLAALYSDEGRYADAEPLYQQALAIKQKALGPDNPDVALSMNNLAELYGKQGRFAEAQPMLEQVLAIRRKALGPDHPDVAMSLNNLAMLYEERGKFADAEPLLQQALEIYRKVLGPEHPKVAGSLSNLAVLYEDEGRYAEAEPYFKQSLAIRQKALGPEHPEVALSLNNLAELYIRQGRYAEAEPLFKQSLAIKEKKLGPEHPLVAVTLSNLARVYEEEGRYAEAEPLFKQSLAIKLKSEGPEDPELAIALNNLAALYKEQGRYADAEPLFKQALAIWQKAVGPEHPDVATVLDNLATMCDDQGKTTEAEQYYKQALAIRLKVLGPEHPDVATTQGNLAVFYALRGRYEEAEAFQKSALAIRQMALGPDSLAVALSMDNLAALYEEQGRYAEAEPLLKQELAIRQKALGPEHPDVATTLNSFGTLYGRQKQFTKAEAVLKQALAIRVKALGPEHPLTGLLERSMAQLYYSWQRPREADDYFDRGFRILAAEFGQQFAYMSEKERLSYLAMLSGNFPIYFSFCLAYEKQLPGLIGKMYDVVLWEKGFVAQSAAAMRARIQAGGDAESLHLLDELTGKKNQIAKLVASLAEGDPQKQAARRQQIGQLDEEANDLEKELVKRSAPLGEEKRLARVSWQEVRDALQPGEAAVEIVNFPFHDREKWTDEYKYVALVLRPESRRPEFIELGAAKNLQGSPFDDYRGSTANPEEAVLSGSKAPPGAALGSGFYAAFWKPLEPALGGARRIYFSPDGELNQLALDVVPLAGGKLLLDSYDLRVVNSTKDILRVPEKPAANDAVLVGNPAFDLTETAERAALASFAPQLEANAGASPESPAPPGAAAAEERGTARGLVNPRTRDLRGGILVPLPGTQKEVESISSLLTAQHWQAQVSTGPEALEERVKAVRHPRVLHLATHGFFVADERRTPGEASGSDQPAPAELEDPMLRSGIFLAGADRVLGGHPPAADMDDGILTAYEAAQLNLQGTELVVLSACETGLGKTQAGEGVFGLRRAFQEAGAESVLMSMWSVPDQETRELMESFYSHWLRGEEKHQALRHAELEEREVVKKRYGRDLPYYWGAFVLVGR